jgi:hypothetical protein
MEDAEFVTLEEIHAVAIQSLPRDVSVYLESGAGSRCPCRC